MTAKPVAGSAFDALMSNAADRLQRVFAGARADRLPLLTLRRRPSADRSTEDEGMNMAVTSDLFERIYEADDDPWGYRVRWYETRKRQLVLACLPARRYRSAYEPGCANGELVAALAPRCDRVTASDGIEAAVALARERLGEFPHVEVLQAWTPREWPDGREFDLIVLSEFAYYLSLDEIDALARKVRQSLAADGTVVACHWRHPIPESPLIGDDVHARLHRELGMPRLVHHEEEDILVHVWSLDARSVAGREGIV